MTQIGNHDDAYLSTPLEEKLAWFQNAPGLSAVEPARQFMAGAAALYTDSDSQVRATMRSLGADWTGDAAANAGATLQRAADWSQGAGTGNAAGGETVEGYGKSFESLRGQVHWDDPWAWGWNDTASAAASVATLDPALFLGNLTTDYFATAQQNRTNDAAAVAALRAHEQQTRAAVGSFPSLAPAGIDPSSADTGVTPAGPHPGGGLPAAPVGPAGVAPAATAGTEVGVAGAFGGGVAAGVSAAAQPNEVGGTGGISDSNGGGAGALASTTADGNISAAGLLGAAPGRVGSSGATVAGAPAGPPDPGAAAPGGIGEGGLVPGSLGTQRPGTGGPGTQRPGTGGPGTGGPGTQRPGAGDPGPQGLGAEGSATRAAMPGAPGALAGRASGGAGPGAPDVRARGGEALGSADGVTGGSASRGAFPGQPATGLRAGDPSGRLAGTPPPAGGTSDGAGGWRDLVPRGTTEPGAISRGSGGEFAARLPSGAPETAPSIDARGGPAGAGMPLLGGMGAGAGARSTEHRQAYWIRSSEPFDVPLPTHGDGLLQGSAE